MCWYKLTDLNRVAMTREFTTKLDNDYMTTYKSMYIIPVHLAIWGSIA